MRAGHLSSLDYENYLVGNNLSEEYMQWLEPVSEHLMECEQCRSKLQKIMSIEYICEEGAMGINDIKDREENIKRIILVETLKNMYKDNDDEAARMQQLIDRIKRAYVEPVRRMKAQIDRRTGGGQRMGASAQACVSASRSILAEGRALFAPDSFTGSASGRRRNDNIRAVSYENNSLLVTVEASKSAKCVTVIIQRHDDNIMVEKAELRDDLWVAEFKCDKLGEYYDIYVDIVTE